MALLEVSPDYDFEALWSSYSEGTQDEEDDTFPRIEDSPNEDDLDLFNDEEVVTSHADDIKQVCSSPADPSEGDTIFNDLKPARGNDGFTDSGISPSLSALFNESHPRRSQRIQEKAVKFVIKRTPARRDVTPIIRRRGLRSQTITRNVKRPAFVKTESVWKPSRRRYMNPKQEPLDQLTALPTGFEYVLKKADIKDSSEYKWKPSHRYPTRRCETKVMLQTADGQVFNKYFEADDICEFANRFKALRCEYGISQAEVGSAVGQQYGYDLSQTTISRFEGLVLSHSNMCKLRPPIEQWIDDVQNAIENGIPVEKLRRAIKKGQFWPSQMHPSFSSTFAPPLRKRRHRTSFDESQRFALETYFGVNQKPDNAQMDYIARTLHLRFDVVRIWFCNRRQFLHKGML